MAIRKFRDKKTGRLKRKVVSARRNMVAVRAARKRMRSKSRWIRKFKRSIKMTMRTGRTRSGRRSWGGGRGMGHHRRR